MEQEQLLKLKHELQNVLDPSEVLADRPKKTYDYGQGMSITAWPIQNATGRHREVFFFKAPGVEFATKSGRIWKEVRQISVASMVIKPQRTWEAADLSAAVMPDV